VASTSQSVSSVTIGTTTTKIQQTKIGEEEKDFSRSV
jgi:hypothetical protein